jgi:hypothetical protein
VKPLATRYARWRHYVVGYWQGAPRRNARRKARGRWIYGSNPFYMSASSHDWRVIWEGE